MYKDGKAEGQGRLLMENSDVVQGHFLEGFFHGPARYHDSVSFFDTWKQGISIQKKFYKQDYGKGLAVFLKLETTSKKTNAGAASLWVLFLKRS